VINRNREIATGDRSSALLRSRPKFIFFGKASAFLMREPYDQHGEVLRSARTCLRRRALCVPSKRRCRHGEHWNPEATTFANLGLGQNVETTKVLDALVSFVSLYRYRDGHDLKFNSNYNAPNSVRRFLRPSSLSHCLK
jgi:hypothetical protein